MKKIKAIVAVIIILIGWLYSYIRDLIRTIRRIFTSQKHQKTMCNHDKLILQKLESIEKLAAESRKLAEGQIGALKDQIKTHTDFTRDKLETMETHHRQEFEYVKGELKTIKSEVTLTNSRVNKLEHNQEVCPINTLIPDYDQYKTKMKPIYLVATSWKMIVGIALIFGVVMTLGQAVVNWFYELVGINIPG
jgi:hypothetical protein